MLNAQLFLQSQLYHILKTYSYMKCRFAKSLRLPDRQHTNYSYHDNRGVRTLTPQ